MPSPIRRMGLNYERIMAWRPADIPVRYGERDCILYALGIGLGMDPLDRGALAFVYERAGLPLLVLGESGPWRRVRDPDGAEVWMHMRNLDTRAMAYVRTAAEMRRNPRPNSGVKARLDPGVIGATGPNVWSVKMRMSGLTSVTMVGW